jgi:hypothetical protein
MQEQAPKKKRILRHVRASKSSFSYSPFHWKGAGGMG